MEDIENELGHLIDKYIKKYEESQQKNQEGLKENEHIFNQLVENTIEPVMSKYSKLVKKKGFITSILHEAGHQLLSVTLRMYYKKPLNSTLLPAIKFVWENRKISIYENKFDPFGLGCSVIEGTYENYQITESFVDDKVSKFLTALFQ
jgi:hypothetical protein